MTSFCALIGMLLASKQVPALGLLTAATLGITLLATLKLHAKFYPLFKDLFIESNPVPVKAALAMLGLCEEQYRLPLVPMTPKNRDALKATLKACGLLK